MTKKMAKWLSCFLTVCMMATSLPIYQTAAHAETTDKNEEEQEPQQDTVSGLGITWDMNWDGEEPAVNDGAEFEKEVWWGDLQGTYQFKSFDADGQVQKIITADKLQLYKWNEESDQPQWEQIPALDEKPIFEAAGVEEELVQITFPEIGTYRISCSELTCGEENSYVTITISYPIFAFFSDKTRSADSFMTECFYGKSEEDPQDKRREFYMITDRETRDVTFYLDRDGEKIAEHDAYFTVSEPETDEAGNTIWQITIPRSCVGKWFSISVTGQVKEEDHYEEIEYGLPISWDDASVAQYDGLAAKTDLLWDDDGTPSQNPDSDEQWSKEHQADLPGMSFYFAKNGGTENIKASDLVLSYVRDDGSLETEGIGVLRENEQNEEITDASFTKTGTYQVALKEKVDADTEPVTIHVVYPVIGFYTTSEPAEDGIVTEEFQYGGTLAVGETDNSTLYLHVQQRPDEDMTVSDLKLEASEWGENENHEAEKKVMNVLNGECDYVSCEELGNGSYQLTISDGCEAYFSLEASVLCNPGENEWRQGSFLNLRPAEAVVAEDGKARTGFSGCFVTKASYEAGSPYFMEEETEQFPNDFEYWVHADTMQGVMEELLAADGRLVEWAGKQYQVKNTGYIYMTMSYIDAYAENAEAAQYVKTPDSIKGICMDSGMDAEICYKRETEQSYDIKIARLRKTDHLEDQDNTDDNTESVLIAWTENGWTYVEKDTEDGKYYITDKLVNDRGFGETEPEPPVDLIEMPSHTSYAMPQIYVDAKTNLKITGDWQDKAPNLQVGFYPNSENRVSVMTLYCLATSVEDGEEVKLDTALMQDENFWNKYNVIRYFYQEKESFDADSIGEKDVSVYHLVRRYSEEDNACWDESQEVSMTVNCVLAKTEASVTGDYTAEGKKPELKIAEDSNVSDLLPNLTEEEEKAYIRGENANLKLIVDQIDTAKANAQIKNEINKLKELAEKSGTVKNLIPLDLNLLLQIGDQKERKVEETKQEIFFSIPVEEALQKQLGTGKLKLKLFRYHGEQADEIPVRYENGRLYASSDKYSTYAIAVMEEKAEAPTPSPSTQPTHVPTPSAQPSPAPTPSTQPTPSAKPTPVPQKKGTKLKKSGVTYQVTKSGAKEGCVAYTKAKKNVRGSVTIPATVTIDGVTYKVTSVAANAFKGNKKITKVTIGKNIEKIGKNAFYGCKKLSSITFKTTKLKASKVGKNAFKGVKAKVTVKVPKNKAKDYKKWLKKKGIPANAKFKTAK